VFKIKEYKKLNSFAELNIKNGSENKIFFDLLKKKIDEEQNIKNLDINQKKILEKVKKDLSGKKTNDDIRFSLSKHVIEEIKTLEDQEIPLYLVHRYRYEIYPQLNILDNYPPYLQIEPSSICNFRCVFCFETDTSFTDKKKRIYGNYEIRFI
tara:strand:+ start:147 stop:605 length:459 start_codon:yes stop_codon:yes gene_type:complete